MLSSSPDAFSIRRAAAADLEVILPLFHAYLQFFGLENPPSSVRQFLKERLESQDTILLAAFDRADPVGFAHLLLSWSSLGLTSIAILNDLFVAPAMRGKYIAAALMGAAEREATLRGMTKLELVTAVDNYRAQSLYRRQQWAAVSGYLMFEKPLPSREIG